MNLIKGGIYSFHKNKGNQYYDFIIFLEQDFDKNFILITRNFYNKKFSVLCNNKAINHKLNYIFDLPKYQHKKYFYKFCISNEELDNLKKSIDGYIVQINKELYNQILTEVYEKMKQFKRDN